MIVIAIDPSARKKGSGVIEYSLVSHEITFSNMDAWKVLERLNYLLPSSFVRAVGIENSHMQNVSFDTRGGVLVAARKARNVGMNQAASKIITEYAKTLTPHVIEFSPKQKGAKLNSVEAQALATTLKIPNFPAKSSQDVRDALKILNLTLKRIR